MKPVEMVKALESIRLKVTRRTILNYEKWGLISEPVKRTGKETEYSEIALFEFIASFRLLHGYMLTPDEVKRIRDLFYERLKLKKEREDLRLLCASSWSPPDKATSIASAFCSSDINIEIPEHRRYHEKIQEQAKVLDSLDCFTKHYMDVWRREVSRMHLLGSNIPEEDKSIMALEDWWML